MSKHYKEKALLATTYKIERLKEQSGFFKKHLNKVIILGAIFSFLAPFYMGEESEKSIMEQSKMSYTESVVFIALVVFSFCVIAHITWTIQDKKRMKRLIKRKEELEEAIKAYDA